MITCLSHETEFERCVLSKSTCKFYTWKNVFLLLHTFYFFLTQVFWGAPMMAVGLELRVRAGLGLSISGDEYKWASVLLLSFCFCRLVSCHMFWEGRPLFLITRADPRSRWLKHCECVFHLSIKDEFLMERAAELCAWPSMKDQQKPWVTHLLCLWPAFAFPRFSVLFSFSFLSPCWSLLHPHTHTLQTNTRPIFIPHQPHVCFYWHTIKWPSDLSLTPTPTHMNTHLNKFKES